MPSIRSHWMLVLGLAVATPVLAAAPAPAARDQDVRREIVSPRSHVAAPGASAQPVGPSVDLNGAWSGGWGPRVVRPRAIERAVQMPVPDPQPVVVGVGGAVALLDVSPSVSQSMRPRGFMTMLHVDETPVERVGSSKRLAILLGEGGGATR